MLSPTLRIFYCARTVCSRNNFMSFLRHPSTDFGMHIVPILYMYYVVADEVQQYLIDSRVYV